MGWSEEIERKRKSRANGKIEGAKEKENKINVSNIKIGENRKSSTEKKTD